MTTTETDRAQDAEIAEALGRAPTQWLLVHPNGSVGPYGPYDSEARAERIAKGTDLVLQPIIPAYSTHPAAFEALMQEIGKRGLGEKWVSALSRLLWPHAKQDEPWHTSGVWAVVSAPLSTRAAAALAALREAKNG